VLKTKNEIFFSSKVPEMNKTVVPAEKEIKLPVLDHQKIPEKDVEEIKV
jgi:hypothetical protein